MNKFILVLFCITLIGCTTKQKLVRLKDRGENVSTVEITGDVKTAQKDIQSIAKELSLIYLKESETEDFVQVRVNLLSYDIKAAFLGVYAAGYTRLGFFFDYNKELNKTKITISEEISSFGNPRRNTFIDKLKIHDMERQQLASK